MKCKQAGLRIWGMTGQEADPATLLRLYVDYGRYAEATTLLLEYLESFSSMVNLTPPSLSLALSLSLYLSLALSPPCIYRYKETCICHSGSIFATVDYHLYKLRIHINRTRIISAIYVRR